MSRGNNGVYLRVSNGMNDAITAKVRVQETCRAICGAYDNRLVTLCLPNARDGESEVVRVKLLLFGAHFRERFLKLTTKCWAIVSRKVPPHHIPEKTLTSVIEDTNKTIDTCDALNCTHCVPGTSPPGSSAVFHIRHSVPSVLCGARNDNRVY